MWCLLLQVRNYKAFERSPSRLGMRAACPALYPHLCIFQKWAWRSWQAKGLRYDSPGHSESASGALGKATQMFEL